MRGEPWETLVEQARTHGVGRVRWPTGGRRPRGGGVDGRRGCSGPEGLVKLVADSGAELVLNALVGAAGLGPTVATLGEGIDLALANKESLVVGGELVTALVEATGAQIVRSDSGALRPSSPADRRRAPGDRRAAGAHRLRRPIPRPHAGRARRRDRRAGAGASHLGHGGQDHDRLGHADEQGTRADRGHHLFGTAYEQIDVVVHPQSIVHSLVQVNDGARASGYPDMRVPISYALHWPERADVPVRTLDLAEVGALTFEPVDEEALPCLRLACEAAGNAGTAPCVLNAANEVAVHAFLEGRLLPGYPRGHRALLDRLGAGRVHSFDSLYEADRQAREAAAELVTARL